MDLIPKAGAAKLTACRNIDWAELDATLDHRERDVLVAIAEGRQRAQVARKHRITRPRVTQIARGIAGKIESHWGADVLKDCAMEPSWRSGTLHASRERAACRYLRSSAA